MQKGGRRWTWRLSPSAGLVTPDPGAQLAGRAAEGWPNHDGRWNTVEHGADCYGQTGVGFGILGSGSDWTGDERQPASNNICWRGAQAVFSRWIDRHVLSVAAAAIEILQRVPTLRPSGADNRRHPRLRDHRAPAYAVELSHGSQSLLFRTPGCAHPGKRRYRLPSSRQASGRCSADWRANPIPSAFHRGSRLEELARGLDCGRGYSGAVSVNEVAKAPAAPKRRTYFRRSTEVRLLPDQVGRQGRITHLAFRLLGREEAITFLNAHHASLGARPLDLATADAAGYLTVESAIRQMAPFRPEQ